MRNFIEDLKHVHERKFGTNPKTKDKVLTWVAICLFVIGLFLGSSVFIDYKNQEVDTGTLV